LRPAAGALALAVAIAAWLPQRWAWFPAAALLAFAVLAAHGARPLAQVLPALALLFLLAPFAIWRSDAPLLRIAAAILLGAAGALLLPSTAGLAAAAALLCWTLPAGGVGAGLQRAWSGILLALAALAAGYPWLREPLTGALAALGLPLPNGVGAAVAIVAVAIAAAGLLRLAAQRVSPRSAGAALATGVAVAVLAALPPPARNVAPVDGVTLRAATPEWGVPVSAPVRSLRVVSTLEDAAALRAGSPVAVLALERAGQTVAAWTLRAGSDTGEWAAERADLRGLAPVGPVWWSWLPPPGTFFAHAYAASWRPPRGAAADRLRVVRAPGVPAEVGLSLLRVEVRP
jgi:hypothetical protein